MDNSEIKRRLEGGRIKKVCFNPFPDGRGGKAHDPSILLHDGTLLRFLVEETDVGDYGVQLIITTDAVTSRKGAKETR